MFAPQFSIRKLLLFTVVCGLFFYLVSMAVRGHEWAIPLVVVGLAAVASLVVYALFFLVAWVFSLVLKDLHWKPQSESPFAKDRPAPQIVPPDQTL